MIVQEVFEHPKTANQLDVFSNEYWETRAWLLGLRWSIKRNQAISAMRLRLISCLDRQAA